MLYKSILNSVHFKTSITRNTETFSKFKHQNLLKLKKSLLYVVNSFFQIQENDQGLVAAVSPATLLSFCGGELVAELATECVEERGGVGSFSIPPPPPPT